MNPVLIPSKARAGSSKTIACCIAEGITPYVFLEPQDVDAYQEAYGDSIIIQPLPENNQGLVYSRNYLVGFGRSITQGGWIWMLDDDISMMGFVVNGKVEKSKYSVALEAAEKYFTNWPNLAILGLEYQQFAWSHKKEWCFNSYCDTAVAINTDAVKRFKYRTRFKHDRDMVLQCLTEGFITVRTSWICFGSPKNGSNKGGLYDEYKAGREREASEEMCRLWPGICTMNVKPDGRPDVKINWGLFKGTVPSVRRS